MAFLVILDCFPLWHSSQTPCLHSGSGTGAVALVGAALVFIPKGFPLAVQNREVPALYEFSSKAA